MWALAAVLFPVGAAIGQEVRKPRLQSVWSIDGGALGSAGWLETTIAITPHGILIDGMVMKGERQHEIIRSFDLKTGQPNGIIEHPDGKPFEGLGDAIAANDRFIVTALHRQPQPGRGGELLVYDARTLELLRRIENPRSADSIFFGLTGVALDGDRILAAVTMSTDNTATAWVFSAETGEVLLTIDEPDVPEVTSGKPSRSFFGRALAMNSTHIAIAANGRGGAQGLFARGEVYVFDASTGSLLHRIKPPAENKATGFGATMAISDDRLHVSGLEPAGEMAWPAGQVYAFDLATGDLVYTLTEPDLPESIEEVGAGNEGTAFPTDLRVGGSMLYSGLPWWTGDKRKQGGLIVFDAHSGERLFSYQHRSGEEYATFGRAIAAGRGYLAVMEEKRVDRMPAARVHLFRLVLP